MPAIGDMRHQVLVENPTRVADGQGGFTETWASATPSPVWAKIEPATPSRMERMVGNAVEGTITHLVTMRYHAGVTLRTRLTFESSRQFHVRGMQNPNERDQWMTLSCEEILS